MYPGTYAAEAPDRIAAVSVRFVDDLPRSETGKLMKSELRARYATG